MSVQRIGNTDTYTANMYRKANRKLLIHTCIQTYAYGSRSDNKQQAYVPGHYKPKIILTKKKKTTHTYTSVKLKHTWQH